MEDEIVSDTVTFRRSVAGEVLAAVIEVPVGVAVTLGGPFVIVNVFRQYNVFAALASLVFGVVPMVMWGFMVLKALVFGDRKLTASHDSIRVRPLVGSTRRCDASAVATLVTYRSRMAALPRFGPPLLVVGLGDLPARMPAELGAHLGVAVDELGDVDDDVLREKYPHNARPSIDDGGSDDVWRGRTWQW